MRVSELCALTVGDINLLLGTLKIRGKNFGTREIELERKVLKTLRSWLAVRPQVSCDNLFLNKDGKPISARGIRKIVVKYIKKAGLKTKGSCYSLRHTFATYKAERGVSPLQLQKWLGNKNLHTTYAYFDMRKQSIRKVMEATSL